MDSALRDRVRAFFDAVPAALAVYLFGSVARGTARAGSDLDVAVLFDETPASTLMGPRLSLESRLTQTVGYQADLIVLNTAPADLVHRILRDGDLVVERDRSRRIRFEVARRNEYFDLQHVRDEYRRMPARTRA